MTVLTGWTPAWEPTTFGTSSASTPTPGTPQDGGGWTPGWFPDDFGLGVIPEPDPDSGPVLLEVVEGEPFAVEFTVVGGLMIWPEPDRQIYAQVRRAPTAPVLAVLATSTTESDGDLLVRIALTGRQTRELAAAIRLGPARYDVFIAEPGPDQARAARVARGRVALERTISVFA